MINIIYSLFNLCYLFILLQTHKMSTSMRFSVSSARWNDGATEISLPPVLRQIHSDWEDRIAPESPQGIRPILEKMMEVRKKNFTFSKIFRFINRDSWQIFSLIAIKSIPLNIIDLWIMEINGVLPKVYTPICRMVFFISFLYYLITLLTIKLIITYNKNILVD